VNGTVTVLLEDLTALNVLMKLTTFHWDMVE